MYNMECILQIRGKGAKENIFTVNNNNNALVKGS